MLDVYVVGPSSYSEFETVFVRPHVKEKPTSSKNLSSGERY